MAQLWIHLRTDLLSDSMPDLLLAQAGGDAAAGGMTLLDQLRNGGIIGLIIIVLGMIAFALIVIHFVAFRRIRMIPPHIEDALRPLLESKDVEGALNVCHDPANDCFLTRVLAAGLNRRRRGALGPYEMRAAIEEAGAEQVARLYRATDVLGLIGTISPMLGLLGTVVGMVGAFDTISAGADRPELLAENISKALVTTLMGLCVAIPVMAAFTWLRNRVDTVAEEAGRVIEDLTAPLEPGAGASGATPAPAAAPTAAGAAQPGAARPGPYLKPATAPLGQGNAG